MTGEFAPEPGENVLVAGTDATALSFCLDTLASVESLLVVATDVPPSTIEAAAPSGVTLHVVNATDHPPGSARTTTVESLPAAGQAAAAALSERTVDALCLDSVSGLLATTSLSETYRFLFMLTARVTAVDAVGLYTLDSPLDAKEGAILGRLFDRRLDLDGEDEDAVTAGTGQPGGDV